MTQTARDQTKLWIAIATLVATVLGVGVAAADLVLGLRESKEDLPSSSHPAVADTAVEEDSSDDLVSEGRGAYEWVGEEVAPTDYWLRELDGLREGELLEPLSQADETRAETEVANRDGPADEPALSVARETKATRVPSSEAAIAPASRWDVSEKPAPVQLELPPHRQLRLHSLPQVKPELVTPRRETGGSAYPTSDISGPSQGERAWSIPEAGQEGPEQLEVRIDDVVTVIDTCFQGPLAARVKGTLRPLPVPEGLKAALSGKTMTVTILVDQNGVGQVLAVSGEAASPYLESRAREAVERHHWWPAVDRCGHARAQRLSIEYEFP